MRILGDEDGRVCGVELEENTLVKVNGEVKARGTGRKVTIELDTIIFAIGDAVDPLLGLPLSGGEFAKSPAPRFPVDGVSYELYDPQSGSPLEGLFCSWLGATGKHRAGRHHPPRWKQCCARGTSIFTNRSANRRLTYKEFAENPGGTEKPVVTKEDLEILERVERQRAEELGLMEFKFDANEEMLAAIGKD